MVYCNCLEDREDLFQEICFQLWKSFPTFKNEARFSTWMYRVALNTAISSVRYRNKKVRFEPLNENLNRIENDWDEEGRAKLLYQAISELNRIDKAIILLWLEGNNYEEIATIMGTTKSNVSVKLVRIKRKLEELVAQKNKQEV